METKSGILQHFSVSVVILAIFFTAMFNSCDYSYLDMNEDNTEGTFGPTYALPLIKSNLSIDDMIDLDETESVEVGDAKLGDDKIIKLIYNGRIYSVDAKELFTIDDLHSQFSYSYTPPSAKSVSETFKFYVDLEGEERIDEISFIEGKMSVNIEADNLINDGYELLFDISVPGSGFSEEFLLQDTPKEFDLDGYTFDFKQDDQGTYLEIDYIISVEEEGTPENSPYDMVFNKNINSDKYEIKGYFDNFDFSIGSDTISLGIFNESVLSEIFFKEPYVNIFANNSMGLPLSIHFDVFHFYNKEKDTIDISGPGFENNNPWKIDYPVIIGDSAMTEAELNRQNSNMDDILEISPHKSAYKISGETNPDQDPEIDNFIRHDSNFNIDVEVNLPLYGSINKYVFQDTLDFSIGEIDNDIDDQIEWIELKFNIGNGFPLNLALQAHFLDENDEKIDDVYLFDDYEDIFKSAKVGADGVVVEKTHEEKKILIEHDKVDEIEDAESIVVSFRISSAHENNNAKVVKIYEDYTIDVRLGTRIKLAIEL